MKARHALSDKRCGYLNKERPSFTRSLGLRLTGAFPDANKIWPFREALEKENAVDALCRRFDAALRAAGYLAMSGQIVDATFIAAPN